MFKKTVSFLPSAILLGIVGLVSFTTVAHAATAVDGGDTSLLDLARPVYEAFAGGHYALSAFLIVLLMVALTKRYLGDKIAWLHSNMGGSAMALIAAFASAAIAGLVAPGATVTFGLMKTALMAGVFAAGGYAVLKNLVVDPILKPLSAKAPTWMQPIFSAVFWIFDHSVTDNTVTIATAERVGDAAVVANPGKGIGVIVGNPGDVP